MQMKVFVKALLVSLLVVGAHLSAPRVLGIDFKLPAIPSWSRRGVSMLRGLSQGLVLASAYQGACPDALDAMGADAGKCPTFSSVGPLLSETLLRPKDLLILAGLYGGLLADSLDRHLDGAAPEPQLDDGKERELLSRLDGDIEEVLRSMESVSDDESGRAAQRERYHFLSGAHDLVLASRAEREDGGDAPSVAQLRASAERHAEECKRLKALTA